MGEHGVRNAGVGGSNPPPSTKLFLSGSENESPAKPIEAVYPFSDNRLAPVWNESAIIRTAKVP